RPLLEVPQDLGVLVVHRGDQPVLGASALQPDRAVTVGEPAGQATHLAERLVRLLLMALRAERVHVTMNAVIAQRHPRTWLLCHETPLLPLRVAGIGRRTLFDVLFMECARGAREVIVRAWRAGGRG